MQMQELDLVPVSASESHAERVFSLRGQLSMQERAIVGESGAKWTGGAKRNIRVALSPCEQMLSCD